MSVQIYLLSLAELKTPELLEGFLEAALLQVDETRREKAQEIRNQRRQAASLGAGLLLQKMVADYQNGMKMQGEQSYTASELLADLRTPLPLQYRFGIHGKPFLLDVPLHFSISHSGDYVLCAASEREVGADIQQYQPIDTRRFAGRFFTEAERAAMEECGSEAERQSAFFRLWSRKEAYGKLTGRGVAWVLNREHRQPSEAATCGSGDTCAARLGTAESGREDTCAARLGTAESGREDTCAAWLGTAESGREDTCAARLGTVESGSEDVCAAWLETAAPEGYAVAVCIEKNPPRSQPHYHT